VREIAAGGFDGFGHPAEDVQTPLLCLGKGGFHDLLGNAGNLDIHLQGGYAGCRSGYLEIHVTKVVLVTEDIGEDGNVVTFLDQAHGNTGHRRLDRDTGIHHGKGTTTDRGH